MKRIYLDYIEWFIPPLEIKEYLLNKAMKPDQVAEIIYRAPRPLRDKYIAFQNLEQYAYKKEDDELLRECNKYIKHIDRGYQEIEKTGSFKVDHCTYSKFGNRIIRKIVTVSFCEMDVLSPSRFVLYG